MPKIKYLHKAIDRLNLLYDIYIKKLSKDNSSLGYNLLLAGFIGADGSFIISLLSKYILYECKAKGNVKCTFSITQRVIDKPTGDFCIPFMREAVYFFQSKINFGKENEMVFKVQANSKYYLLNLILISTF